MKKSTIMLLCLSGLVACANKHPDCVQADSFGHCKQWEGQPQTCADPDFLGFCPRG